MELARHHLLVDVVVAEDEREGLLGEVAAADEPFVVLLDQQRAGEPDRAGVVGEDPDDVGAAADLAVDALQRVGRAELGPVRGGEAVERQQVLLGGLEQLGDLRRRAARRSMTSPKRRGAPSWLSALKTSRSAAETRPRCAGRQWPCMLRTKCTVQRCHGRVQDPGDRVLQARGARRRRTAAARAGRARAGRARTRSRTPRSRPRRCPGRSPRGGRSRHGVGDHQRLRVHVAAVADLDVLGVQPQVRVRALERPLRGTPRPARRAPGTAG